MSSPHVNVYPLFLYTSIFRLNSRMYVNITVPITTEL